MSAFILAKMQQYPTLAYSDAFPPPSFNLLEVVVAAKPPGSPQLWLCIMCILPGQNIAQSNARENLATEQL